MHSFSFSPFARLVFLAGLLSASGIYAQDNIILKNGAEIQGKVLEVSPGQIKYRRQDNPDGPVYTTGTTDVLLIKYANGTKDVLNQPATRQLRMSPVPMNPSIPGTVNSTGSATPGRLGYHAGLFSRYFTDVDYLLKPFSVERFAQAVHKAANYAHWQQWSNAQLITYLSLRVESGLVQINIADIAWIEALSNYLKIYLSDQRFLVVRMTMKAMLEQLPSTNFIPGPSLLYCSNPSGAGCA